METSVDKKSVIQDNAKEYMNIYVLVWNTLVQKNYEKRIIS